MWRPSDGLDCGGVVGVFVQRSSHGDVPHQQTVIIAAGGQVLMFGRPLQTADFLSMATHPTDESGSILRVPINDEAISAAYHSMFSLRSHERHQDSG